MAYIAINVYHNTEYTPNKIKYKSERMIYQFQVDVERRAA